MVRKSRDAKNGISIHFLHKEEDDQLRKRMILAGAFQSTSSTRRKTKRFWKDLSLSDNFNPLPPQGGRRHLTYCYLTHLNISIHFLHKEEDGCRTDLTVSHLISIHFLHKEEDPYRFPVPSLLWKFQSTSSTRRKTNRFLQRQYPNSYFNPLPPQGGRPVLLCSFLPLMGFQSTSSTRRKTFIFYRCVGIGAISIHFLHKEEDWIHNQIYGMVGISIHFLHKEEDLHERNRKS